MLFRSWKSIKSIEVLWFYLFLLRIFAWFLFKKWNYLLDPEEHKSAGLASVPTTSESVLACTFLCGACLWIVAFQVTWLLFFGAGKEVIWDFHDTFYKHFYAGFFLRRPCHFVDFFTLVKPTSKHKQRNISSWGFYIFHFPVVDKFFCLIREQNTNAWNVVTKFFQHRQKKPYENISPLLPNDAVCARNVCARNVGNVKMKPLKPCWLSYTLHNSYWKKETCTQSNAYYQIGGKAQSFCWPQYLIRNNWNSLLVECTGLLSAVHPCTLVACAAAIFLNNGRRAAKLYWCQGNVLWFWRISIGWNC